MPRPVRPSDHRKAAMPGDAPIVAEISSSDSHDHWITFRAVHIGQIFALTRIGAGTG
jgi:hypothetical protein